ncbi:MAG: MerR family transcriptional regulator [Prevotella sp.]|nr:MerR family transcriptional regulator [Staphylococcus sp.]MCM1350164.1 MerR family transcriptional regulator [Prevotella sp.]
MTIREVSKKYNISPDTLRYYEKVGVIKPVTRKNGIRQYGDKEIDNIEFVVCMRNAGISIEALVKYIKLFDEGDQTAGQRKQILIDEREKLKIKLDEMNKAMDRLNYKIDVYYSEMLEKENEMLRRKK